MLFVLRTWMTGNDKLQSRSDWRRSLSSASAIQTLGLFTQGNETKSYWSNKKFNGETFWAFLWVGKIVLTTERMQTYSKKVACAVWLWPICYLRLIPPLLRSAAPTPFVDGDMRADMSTKIIPIQCYLSEWHITCSQITTIVLYEHRQWPTRPWFNGQGSVISSRYAVSKTRVLLHTGCPRKCDFFDPQ